MNVQLNGGHLFSAFFPLYCQVGSSGQYPVSYSAVDDYFYVSVNGGSFVGGSFVPRPNSIGLTAGINRVVVYYSNNAWSGAYLHFSVQGVSQWYHPALLSSCEGEIANACIPSVGSLAGLESGINGLIYYHGAQSVSGVAMPIFAKFASQAGFPNVILPDGASRFASPATQFNFWTDRTADYTRSSGSVEWPEIGVIYLRPIITAGQTASGKVGTAFSKTFSLTDSTNRPVTSWAATGLPPGLSINATTGAITGTPLDSGNSTITLTATGPGGTDTETAVISIVKDLDLSVSLSAAAVVATSLVIDYRAALAGVTALDAGGSWELYRDVEPIFLGESRWGGSPGVQEPGFVTIDLVRFVWGEFDIVRGFTGRVGVFCFTTLDGRITPEPLVQVGLRFLEGRGTERLQYRAAFTGPGRPFDYVSVPEDGSVIEDEIVITEGRAYGVYNIWATENLPPGQVKVHFSVHLYRDA